MCNIRTEMKGRIIQGVVYLLGGWTQHVHTGINKKESDAESPPDGSDSRAFSAEVRGKTTAAL